jgi:hypothetical protein
MLLDEASMRAMKRNAARHSPSTGRRRLPDGVGGADGKGAAQDAGVSNTGVGTPNMIVTADMDGSVSSVC